MYSFDGDTTAYFEYVPDAVGNYTLQFFFAGDYYPIGYYINGVVVSTAGSTQSFTGTGYNATQDCYYQPSYTSKYTLVVQQDMVASWSGSALPGAGDYWSRPISPDNREWWVIGGNYPYNEVGGGAGTTGWPDNTNVYASNYKFIPYVEGPKSAHIAWRRNFNVNDGVIGGLIDNAASPAQEPASGASGPTIVFEGRCYQTITEPFNGITQTVWECYDIQTGKIYWDLTNVTRVPTMISYAEPAGPVPGA
jgi:hypothetical protein